MENPDTEIEIKFAAFASAVSEMLASVLGEVLVVRQMLSERISFSDDDYKTELRAFARQRWASFVEEVSDKLRKLTEEKERKLRQMASGEVN